MQSESEPIDGSEADQAFQTFSESLNGNRDVLAATTRSSELLGLARHGVSVVNVAARRTWVRPGTGAGGPIAERRLNPSALPYPAGMFDGLWIDMPNIPADWRDLRHYHRVLTPAGVLAVPLGGSGRTEGTAEETWRHLRRIGFQPVGGGEGTAGGAALLAIKQAHGAPPRDDCALCPRLRFRLNRLEALPGAVGVLWGDDAFFVMPDLAPLDEGHLLIVTVDHALAMGSCSDKLLRQLEIYLGQVRALFRAVYDCDAIFFEHGPSIPGEAGACVDHAHMHCLPMRGSLLSRLEREGFAFVQTSLAELAAYHKGGDSYLFVQKGEDRMICATVKDLPNQLMRYLYASVLDGRPWRWQDMYMQTGSRRRFMAGLNALLPLVDEFLAMS